MASEMQAICFTDPKPAKILKWKIQENYTITAGIVICTYQYQDEIASDGNTETSGEENSGKNSQNLQHVFRATTGGVVDKLLLKEGDPITKGTKILTLKECTHPTVMKDLCAECGADLREVKQRNRTAAVAIVHNIPELMVSMEEAQSLGRADEQRLLRDRKLVLLVDLDQTLIHTTNDSIPSNIKDVYHFRLHGTNSPWYHTRFRPYTLDFLEKVSKMYELHICTFGSRTYAHTIAGLLDKEGRYFSHRILSRDECFSAHSKIANMKAIFPCGDHMVCIIDDREDVWSYAPNLIHVRPYHFFQHTGDINAPPGLAKQEFDDKEGFDFNTLEMKKTKEGKDEEGDDDEEKSKDSETTEEKKEENEEEKKASETEDGEVAEKENGKTKAEAKEEKKRSDDLIDPVDEDDYLLHLENILTTIHQAYYAMYDQTLENKSSSEAPDMKRIIPYVRRKTLQGVTLVFSGVIPTHVPLEKSRPYLVARSLGASVSEKVTEKTTHLVAARLGTTKVNDAKKVKGIHVVTPDWLWCCAERWEHVDERLYPLNNDTCAVTRKPPPHCSSPDVTLQLAVAASVPEKQEEAPIYDRVTGKRIFPNKNAEKGKAWAEGKRPQPPPRRFSETINPLLMFSSDELANMDQEVEDILHEGEDEDEEEEDEEAEEATMDPDVEEEEEREKRNKRKRKFDEVEEGTETLKLGQLTEPDDKENLSLLEKFRHGEDIPRNFGEEGDEDTDQDDGDEDFGREDGGEQNEDWDAAGEALEREFLSESEEP